MSNEKIVLKEKLGGGRGLTGKMVIRRHPAGSIERFKKLLAEGKKEEYLAELHKGEIAAVQNNLIMTNLNIGTDIVVQWLGSVYILANGGSVLPVGINYGAIGTGSTTPTANDTQLTTETNRTTVSFFQDFQFNVAQLQFFFTDATLSNTTFYEFGTFVNGTGSANSGSIFNHALFASPYVKTAGTDTTVEVDITT